MKKYILERVLYTFLIMTGIIFIIMLIVEIAPGSPATAILGVKATPEQIEAFNATIGFDQPFFIRVFQYIKNILLHFDFGTSYKFGVNVWDKIMPRLPITFCIAFVSVILNAVVGVIGGILCARHKDGVLDYCISSFAGISSALPSFWLAQILLIIFSQNLGILPSYGLSSWTGYILPILTIVIVSSGNTVKTTRAVILDVSNQDYIRTARSYGEKEFYISYGHMLKNAMLPILTSIGNNFIGLMSGTVVMESVFAIPGLGTLLVESISSKDLPMVCAITILLAGIFCLVQLLIDLSYAFFDPRIRAKYGM